MARRTINLDRLPSNNEQEIEMVLKGSVRTRPRGGMANRIRDIGNSLFEEIVIPTLKDGFLNFAYEALVQLVKGSSSYSVRGRGEYTAYHKQYRQYRRRGTDRQKRDRRRAKRIESVFEDVYFDNRRDAEMVLGRLMEYVVEYGWATVGDLYHLVGLSSDTVHQDWGWTELVGIRVQYTTEGYIIDLPDPVYLK